MRAVSACFVFICLGAATACGDGPKKTPPDTTPTPAEQITNARATATSTAQRIASDQDLNVGSPTYGSLMPGHPPLAKDNISWTAGEGLLVAWRMTEDQNALDAAIRAADFVAQRTGSFASGEPRFLVSISNITGDQSYADVVRTRFFDPLQQGTYQSGATQLDLAGYVAKLVANRSGQAVNLAAWDFAFVVEAAYMLQRPEAHDYLVALQSLVDRIQPGSLPPNSAPVYWEVLSLSESLRAIVMAGDPDHYVCAGTNFPALAGQNVEQLVATIAGQVTQGGDQDGAFPYQLNLFPVFDDVQTTAYGLSLAAQTGMMADTSASVAYLRRLQESNGAFAAGVGRDSTTLGATAPEVASEALQAILAATPGAVKSGSDDCKKKVSMSVGATCQ